MSHRRGSRFVTPSLLVLVLEAAATSVAGQVRPAPGGVRVPGTTVAREAPLLNWSDVTVSTFALRNPGSALNGPFRLFALETVEGSQHWVERTYGTNNAWGIPALQDTKVFPSGARMVYSVSGYGPVMGGFGGWGGGYAPTLRFALLIPISSQSPGTGFAGRRARLAERAANPATLRGAPVAQTLGYKLMPAAPAARGRGPGACDASAEYQPDGPRLSAACVVLDPGQAVDLPNQLRIVRVGDNYRIVVGGSLVDDVPAIAIVRLEPGRYYVLSEVGQGY